MKYRLLLILSCLMCVVTMVSAQERIEKRYSIFFRAGKYNVDFTYSGNGRTLETMISDIKTTLETDGYSPDSLLIYASASPEGSVVLNEMLAQKRALSAKDYILSVLPQLKDAEIKIESRPNDWSGIIQTLRANEDIPFREQILKILTDSKIVNKEAVLRQTPQAYAVIRDGMFDKMRTATVTIRVIGKVDEFAAKTNELTQERTAPLTIQYFGKIHEMTLVQEAADPVVEELVQEPVQEPVVEEEPVIEQVDEKKPFYIGVKNNMLYDLGIVPNIGAEFYLGKNFSIVGNWMYSWWKSDKVYWYWRIYGGDLAVRYWFGKSSRKKPLQGHHVGPYGQIITYDFEVGNKGILADRWSWSAGLEYGYSVPVAKRLNIDFTLGAGYHKGEFYEYLPIDGHYVWQATKRRQYFGPTKFEISLVWLIGRGNENIEKGGKR